ncbi:MAG: hypothetical protein Q4G68_05705 [Planctomycetia bacterium]|nr:hypothetical protein [Planctomycetia bacterium]
MAEKTAKNQSPQPETRRIFCPFAEKSCLYTTCEQTPKPATPSKKKGGASSRLFFLLVLLLVILGPRVLRDRNLPFNVGRSSPGPDPQVATGTDARLRIATWNLDPLDYKKVSNPVTCERIATVVSQFDLIALGGVRARNETVVETLLTELQRQGYVYEVGSLPPPGLTVSHSLFLFRPQSIVMDPSTLFNVILPDREGTPLLCASFRAAAAEPERAFTFTLVHFGSCLRNELPAWRVLREVWEQAGGRAGRHGSAEDDLLLLGCFGVSPYEFGDLISVNGLAVVHYDVSTSLTGIPCNNLIFNERATTEYTERFGVLSPLEYFRMTPREAKELSLCEPFWVEFTACETSFDSHYGGHAVISSEPPTWPNGSFSAGDD